MYYHAFDFDVALPIFWEEIISYKMRKFNDIQWDRSEIPQVGHDEDVAGLGGGYDMLCMQDNDMQCVSVIIT